MPKVAVVQLRSRRDPAASLDEAEALIRAAAADGAVYVLTPENTNVIEADRAGLMAAITTEAADPSLKRLRALAAELRIHLHVGSLALAVPGDDRAANRGILIGPDGAVKARYDKIHMFDVDLPNGDRYRESERMRPGARAVVADAGFAPVGMMICYDLRFPHLARRLAKAGASLLAYPSAFTRPTGEAHWHVLLRARAIETGSFVLAAAQGGRHETGRETYGHSLVVGPWGEVLGELGTEPGTLTVDIDLAEVAAARARIPALRHDRPFRLTRAGTGP